jgi:hypothetical protein
VTQPRAARARQAERNVLPTLNNLLENREMALDDGVLRSPPRRPPPLSY